MLLSKSETNFLEIARSVGDLRRGMPILVDNAFLMSSLETIDKTTFESISEDLVPILVVPSVKFTREESNSDLCFFALKNCSFEQLEELCCGDVSEYKNLQKIKCDSASFKEGISLLKMAELLPIALIYKVNNISEVPDVITKIDSKQISKYSHSINNDLKLVGEVDLNLKYAPNTKILSFRSKFLGQDHYAIIVGDISKLEVPSVRIHSSCYTGDLMASLTCDCRDQLMETIKYMSSSDENAGIVVYLQQEGRGIGLTNKLRTYQLQQQGHDTVEANHLLGFQEDERVFDAAAAMLNAINISKVNLLTNNPKKIKFLEDKNIKVCKTISLLGEVNKYNQSYLETKKEKMGHML